MLTHPALPVVNPSSGAHLRDVPCDSADELGLKLDHSREAQARWSRKSVEVRVRELSGALDYFRRRKESVARDIAREMGKPLSQALGEVETLLARCEHMLSIAPAALAPEALAAPSGFEFRIEHAPIGLVLDIAAWNYPLIVPASVVIPALAAGNAVILKHSPRCPAAGEHFEQALAVLSEPEIFQHVVVPDSEAGALVADPRIDHVCFTGSPSVGREVWRTAAARGIGVALELGGKDPAYVAADAELDPTTAGIVEGACYNAGQSCCAIERAYVHESLYEAFLERATLALQGYVLGDPLEATTTMGPLIDSAALERVERHVADAIERGARLLCGGRRSDALAGSYFEPTLLADCPDDALVMREETFGPVLPVRAVRDDDEALACMNDSPFGLSASIWTRDSKRVERFARALEVGTVFQNRCDFPEPCLPWTGWKGSGLGSTLSRYGYHHLTRRKSVHLKRHA